MNGMRAALAGIVGALLLSGAAAADEMGRQSYLTYCSGCHGEKLDGKGPLAELITVPVPPLDRPGGRQ